MKYYSDVHLLVNRRRWRRTRRSEHKVQWQIAQSRQGSSYYYKPGLTFTSRCSSFSVRVLPEGCVISHNAPTIYGHTNEDTLFLMGWLNSRLMRALVEIQANKEYYVPGSVKTLPWKMPEKKMWDIIRDTAVQLCYDYKELTTTDETTAFFAGRKWHSSIIATFEHEQNHHSQVHSNIQILQRLVSKTVDEIYRVIAEAFAAEIVGHDPDEEVISGTATLRDLGSEALSFCVGGVIGRWSVLDIEHCNNSSLVRSLPAYSPKMLQAPDGNGLATLEQVPNDYPLCINWNGILVDDPDHHDDIVRRVREVLEIHLEGPS